MRILVKAEAEKHQKKHKFYTLRYFHLNNVINTVQRLIRKKRMRLSSFKDIVDVMRGEIETLIAIGEKYRLLNMINSNKNLKYKYLSAKSSALILIRIYEDVPKNHDSV